jgi:hypothetical protein
MQRAQHNNIGPQPGDSLFAKLQPSLQLLS